jgi:transposase
VESLAITAEEQIWLRELACTTHDAKVAVRVRVILALAADYSTKTIAELFLLSEQTVLKWRDRYERRTLFSDWLATRAKGSAGKLTRAQKRELKAYVRSETITDAQIVCDFISDAYGVAYTTDGVRKLLHKLGFVYKKTTLVPGKLNEKAQAAFVEEIGALSESLPEDEVILYGDVVHPQWNVQASYAWILRGEEKQVLTNSGREHMNISGAYDVASCRSVIHYTPPKQAVNFDEALALFSKIEESYPEKRVIHIILDNAGYFKKAWRLYLEDGGGRIQVHWLPSYSPNLNLIERLWRFMHRDIIGVKRRETLAEFEKDISAFFASLSDYETRLRQFIGTEPHLIKLAN